MNLVEKIFGTHSKHEVKRINPILKKVLSYSEKMGKLTDDDKVVLSECAGVLQYAQTCFEGLKAYRTAEGKIQLFRPIENARRLNRSGSRF